VIRTRMLVSDDTLLMTSVVARLLNVALARCERVISEGIQTFVDVGSALARIRDDALYRATHGSFEAYCRERWSLSRKRAYDLMGASQIVRELSPMGDIPMPANERQARELSDLPTETAAEVMRAAAESGPVTAASIALAREGIAPRPAHVTTTTRTTEATKVERDVDLGTGEIIDGGLAEQAGRDAADALDLDAILPPEGPEERAARLRLNFARALAAAGIIHTPVTGARGLLWLAEAARDLGIEPVSMMWRNNGRPGHEVHVPTRAALDALGDRLGLEPIKVWGGLATRRGTWADMSIELYTGADR